jgi:predicted transport protein
MVTDVLKVVVNALDSQVEDKHLELFVAAFSERKNTENTLTQRPKRALTHKSRAQDRTTFC